MPISSVTSLRDSLTFTISGTDLGYSTYVQLQDGEGNVCSTTITARTGNTSITARATVWYQSNFGRLFGTGAVLTVRNGDGSIRASRTVNYDAYIQKLRNYNDSADVTGSVAPGTTLIVKGSGFQGVRAGRMPSSYDYNEIKLKNLSTNEVWTLSTSNYNVSDWYDDTSVRITIPSNISAANAVIYMSGYYGTRSNELAISVVAPLQPPATLSVTDITAYSAKATWTAVSGVTGYRVKLYDGNAVTTLGDTTALFYNITNLTPNQPYIVYVYSLQGQTESTSEIYRPFTTLPPPTPQPPDTITVSDQTTDSCFISWSESPTATAYRIYINDIDMTPDYTVAAPQRSVAVSGLTPNALHGAYIQAVNEYGGGNISPVAVILLVPGAPSGIQYSSMLTSASIGWASNPIAASYRIDMLDPSSMEVVTIEPAWPMTSITVNNLQPSTTYTFFLYAVNSTSSSQPTAVRVTTKTDQPQNLNVLSRGDTEATVTWEPPNEASGVIGYCVRLFTETGTQLLEVSEPLTSNAYTFTDLAPDTTYRFMVATEFGREGLPDELSGFAGPVEFTTLLATPTGLTQTDATTTTISMEWNVVPGATLYRFRPHAGAGNFDEFTTALDNHVLEGLNVAYGYYVEMRAESPDNYSDWTSPWVQMYTRPHAPVATALNSATSSTLTLRWGAVAAEVYRIDYRKSSDAAWTRIEIPAWGGPYNDPEPVTSHVLTGLEPGTYYYARITAVWPLYNTGTMVESEPSNSVYSNTILDQAVIHIQDLQKFSFVAQWDTVPGAVRYLVWLTYSGGSSSQATFNQPPYEKLFEGLKRNFSYTVHVRAESPIAGIFSESALTVMTLGAPLIHRVLVDDGEVGTFLEIEGENFGTVLAVYVDGVEVILNGYKDTGADAWVAPDKAGSMLYVLTDAGPTNTVPVTMRQAPSLAYVPPKMRIGGYYAWQGLNFGRKENLVAKVGSQVLEVTGTSLSTAYVHIPPTALPSVDLPYVETNTGADEYDEVVTLFLVSITDAAPVEAMEGTTVALHGTGLDEVSDTATVVVTDDTPFNVSMPVTKESQSTVSVVLPYESDIAYLSPDKKVNGDNIYFFITVQLSAGDKDSTVQEVASPQIKVLKRPRIFDYSWRMPGDLRSYQRPAIGSTQSVSGKYFGAESGTVRIGSVDQPVVSWSNTAIEFTLADGSFVDQPVEITAADGRVGFAPAITHLREAPEILTVAPLSGKPGHAVTIVGFDIYIRGGVNPTAFIDGYNMNTVSVTQSFEYDVAEGRYKDKLVATIAHGTPAGEQDLWVATDAGESNIVPFTVLPYDPEITDPTEGHGTLDRSFFVFGYNFGLPTAEVVLDEDVLQSVVSWDDRVIEISLGGVTPGVHVLKVKTADGISNGWTVKVYENSPVIEAPTPTSVTKNEVFKIYGANFGDEKGTSYITFGDTVPNTLSWSDREIELSLPVTGSHELVVHTDKPSNSWSLTVDTDDPVIDGLSRTYGGKNKVVIIFGHDFDTSGKVYMDTYEMPVRTWNTEFIVTAVPPEAWSATDSIKRHITVETTEGKISNEFPFTVTYYGDAESVDWDNDRGYAGTDADGDGYPDAGDGGDADGSSNFYIDYITPEKGTKGSAIDIIGEGFGEDVSTSDVIIGDIACEIRLWSPTKITALIPDKSPYGPVKCYIKKRYTRSNAKVLDVLKGNLPVVFRVYPAEGVPGGAIIIEGRDFGENRKTGRMFHVTGHYVVDNYTGTRSVYYEFDEYIIPSGVSVLFSKRRPTNGVYAKDGSEITLDIKVWKSSHIACSIPSVDIPAGDYYVIVITDAGAANAGVFFKVPEPKIIYTAPYRVKSGENTWIQGQHLGTINNFKSANVEIVRWSNERVMIKAPVTEKLLTFSLTFYCRNGATNAIPLLILPK